MAKKAKGTAKAKSVEKSPTRLERIAAAIAACKDAQGRIVPKRVVEAARNPSSVLHGEFEWNVQQAAQQAWEARARELIREVRLFIEHDPPREAAPYYVSDPRAKTAAYAPTLRIARSPATAARVLQMEVARIRAAVQRARGLAMVFGLEASLDKMLAELMEVETVLAGEEA